jgi:hypothetical protein
VWDKLEDLVEDIHEYACEVFDEEDYTLMSYSIARSMSSPTTYRPGEDANAENERALLAAAYNYILSCHAIEKGARPGARDDAEGLKNDRTDTEIIPG